MTEFRNIANLLNYRQKHLMVYYVFCSLTTPLGIFLFTPLDSFITRTNDKQNVKRATKPKKKKKYENPRRNSNPPRGLAQNVFKGLELTARVAGETDGAAGPDQKVSANDHASAAYTRRA